VVDSILRGVEIGIGPRRTRQTNKDKDKEQSSNTVRHFFYSNKKYFVEISKREKWRLYIKVSGGL